MNRQKGLGMVFTDKVKRNNYVKTGVLKIWSETAENRVPEVIWFGHNIIMMFLFIRDRYGSL